jgi:integrase
MKTTHAPYSLYRKKTGERYYWYVRFWDERTKKYSANRATGIEVTGKKERKAEAEAAALELLPKICFNVSNMTMIQYVSKFWRDDSPYFREHEKVYGHKLSAYYSKSHLDVIRLHIAPYPPFAGIGIEKLDAGLIRDWMLWMAERGASGSRINRAMQVIRVPLRYAIDRDEAKTDPFSKIKPAHEIKREKGVLTKKEVMLLMDSPVKGRRNHLAVLLGILCGMRLGEIRGLHWQDIDEEAKVIHICHNWQDMEGVKQPKNGSMRDVPLPDVVVQAVKSYLKKAKTPSMPLIFGRKDGKPFCNGYFRLTLIRELDAIGIPQAAQRERNITFHSLRHTFISLARLAGINNFQAQALAGHKTSGMMERYSHPGQVIEIAECGKIIEGFFKTA